MGDLTQGSIIYGIRSQKYPDMSCYGIIISARCDVANCKVPKLYCLIGLNAEDWLSSENGHREIYKDREKELLTKLKGLVQQLQLDPEVLLKLSSSELKIVLEAQQDLKKSKRSEIMEALLACNTFRNAVDTDARKNAIRRDPKPAIAFLDKCARGEIFHYCFLPQPAYMSDGCNHAGIVVDLQEVIWLSLTDAERIQSPGIDNMCPPENMAECRRLQEIFWLEDEDDFVLEYATIKSPWIEHLMQRFSHSFIRIGVDGATKNDLSKLIEKI